MDEAEKKLEAEWIVAQSVLGEIITQNYSKENYEKWKNIGFLDGKDGKCRISFETWERYGKENEKEIGVNPKENLKQKVIGGFNKKDIAQSIIDTQPCFYDTTKNWWLWDCKEFMWMLVDETDILNAVDDNAIVNTINSKEKGEIIEALKQVSRKNKPIDIKKSWIQFKDTIFDIKSGESFMASPKYFITNPIPQTLTEKTDTPNMDRIFEEWVGKKNIQQLYEILAYSLIPDYPIHRIFCFIGSGLNGKCQKGTNKVLMSNGTWKQIKDVRVGDEIISPQKNGESKFCKVKNTHNRFEENVYDIVEKNRDKKILYTCAGNHIIPIIRNYTKRTSKDDSTPRESKRVLSEYDAEHISKLDNSKSQICSFTTTAIKYKQPDSKINPYCLGAWLGDGHFRSIRVQKKDWNGMKRKGKRFSHNGNHLHQNLGITTMDFEIINEFYMNYGDDNIRKTIKPNNKASTYNLSVIGKFAKELTILKLNGKGSGDKFIPKECLLSSLKYRRELLAGLIDTDGFIQKKTGATYYTTKSKQLAEDIKQLVFSIGGYSRIRQVTKKSQNGTKGNYYELSLQFKEYDILPMRLKRKSSRNSNKKYSPRNIAIECIKTKPQQVYGIEIEGDSKWYITDNWMVTHNSCFLNLLRKFIGTKNCCSTELDTLISSRFEVTRLHKKLVCQMGETDFGEMRKTSLLKKLSGDDLIGFEYKGKNPFEEKNYAKIMIATNNLPATTDKTIGFYRRWMIIDFLNTFSEKKDILSEIPDEEYCCLASKCCKILKVLLEKREFTNEGSIDDRKKKYEDKSNFLEQFLKEYTDNDAVDYISKADFYKKFIGWCKENRHREMAENTVGLTMKKLGIESSRKYVDWLFDGKGGQMRVWSCIKWKE